MTSERTADADVALLHEALQERATYYANDPELVAALDRLAALVAQHRPPDETEDAEAVARLFHETYERLAPAFGYETRKDSAVPWEDVPEPNKSLMVAVAAVVREALVAQHRDEEYREGMVTVRGHDQAHLGCMGTETWKWLLDHPEMDAPALDRLVAQHRDTQEALAAADALVDAYGNMVARDGKFYAYMDARAAMPGTLPCGHPESDETTDALGNTICSVCSVAALASVPTEATEFCRRCRDTQEALADSANRFDLIRRMIKNSKTAPNIWESLADTAKWGEEAARAALASIRARSET